MNSDLTVRDVMNREYVGVSESDSIADTVELLLREDATEAVVLRGQDPVGVLTERDVYAVLVESDDPAEAAVGEAPLTNVPTVAPDVSLDAAADRMATRSVRRLRVVDRGEMVGLLTDQHLLAARAPQGTESLELETEPDAETVSMPAGTIGTQSRGEVTEVGVEAEFDDQSICEGCGTLAHNLAAYNGQLLCGDCRDI